MAAVQLPLQRRFAAKNGTNKTSPWIGLSTSERALSKSQKGLPSLQEPKNEMGEPVAKRNEPPEMTERMLLPKHGNNQLSGMSVNRVSRSQIRFFSDFISVLAERSGSD